MPETRTEIRRQMTWLPLSPDCSFLRNEKLSRVRSAQQQSSSLIHKRPHFADKKWQCVSRQQGLRGRPYPDWGKRFITAWIPAKRASFERSSSWQ